MLAAARAALHDISSYRVRGMLDNGFTVDLRVSRTGLTGRVTSEHVSWDVVQDHGRLWFRGRRMWAATISPDQARSFADSWVRVTSLNAGFGWAAHLVDLQRQLPDDVFRDKPGLHNVGTRSYAGRTVIRLSSPKDIYDVAAVAPHMPVRWLEPDEVGPDGKPCGIVLDGFGQPVHVAVPVTTFRY